MRERRQILLLILFFHLLVMLRRVLQFLQRTLEHFGQGGGFGLFRDIAVLCALAFHARVMIARNLLIV